MYPEIYLINSVIVGQFKPMDSLHLLFFDKDPAGVTAFLSLLKGVLTLERAVISFLPIHVKEGG